MQLTMYDLAQVPKAPILSHSPCQGNGGLPTFKVEGGEEG